MPTRESLRMTRATPGQPEGYIKRCCPKARVYRRSPCRQKTGIGDLNFPLLGDSWYASNGVTWEGRKSGKWPGGTIIAISKSSEGVCHCCGSVHSVQSPVD